MGEEGNFSKINPIPLPLHVNRELVVDGTVAHKVSLPGLSIILT